MHLDDAGDVTVVGLVQKQGAEDIIEECGVVSAGSLTVRVKVHLQDLGLHHSLSWWQNREAEDCYGSKVGIHICLGKTVGQGL